MPATPLPADWVEHRRDDGERLGWIHPSGAHYTAVDVLGRCRRRQDARAKPAVAGTHRAAAVEVWRRRVERSARSPGIALST